MAKASVDQPVNRLVDMEVREVSLVDRAANKRRFLVVKRSEMAQNGGAGDTGNDQTGGEGDEGQDVGSDGEGQESEAVLGVAATALESVADAMTRLQSAGGDAQRGEVGNVIAELRAAADKLAAELGDDGEPGNDDGEGDDAGGDDDAEPPATGDGRFDTLIGAMTGLIGELRATRTQKGKPPADDEQPQDEEDPPAPAARKGKTKPEPKRPPPAPARKDEGLRGDIRALRGELKGLTGSLQQHAQRLGRLEKRAGVPASRPAGERNPAGSRPPERAWPLDLNGPRNG